MASVWRSAFVGCLVDILPSVNYEHDISVTLSDRSDQSEITCINFMLHIKSGIEVTENNKISDKKHR